jgi:hypothetical protein
MGKRKKNAKSKGKGKGSKPKITGNNGEVNDAEEVSRAWTDPFRGLLDGFSASWAAAVAKVSQASFSLITKESEAEIAAREELNKQRMATLVAHNNMMTIQQENLLRDLQNLTQYPTPPPRAPETRSATKKKSKKLIRKTYPKVPVVGQTAALLRKEEIIDAWILLAPTLSYRGKAKEKKRIASVLNVSVQHVGKLTDRRKADLALRVPGRPRIRATPKTRVLRW